MNKHLYRAAAALGLLAVGWVASGYLRSNPLAHAPALAMTLLIAVAFIAGTLELRRFRQATAGLQQGLDGLAITPPTTPPQLDDWLDQLPAPLRHTVRLRVEGERAGLPGPALTPYLVGLLVLLGMLGTFLGMVVTLNGTGLALESATDVQTMRDSLAAPVRGLGLAFGTSVAGVAASAMLGLMSALSRRERLQAGQQLDTLAATTLRPFSRRFQQAQQHEQALRLQQQQLQQQLEQAQHLPALVNQLQLLAAQVQQSYAALAASMDQTLQRSLTDSARQAAATLQPAVQAAMAGITRETAALHGHIASTVQQQLDGFAQRFEERSAGWVDTLGTQLATQDRQRLAAWTAALEDSAGRIGTQAEAQARHTVAEVARLVQAASDAPRAAADVVAQLREKLSESLVRDNAMLDERQRLMDTLHTLLGAVQHSATEQKTAIDTLVASTAAWLEQAGTRFTEKVDAESARLEYMAAQLSGSAADVASLGEAFGGAVQLFTQSAGQTVVQLQGVEEALARSSARSDEQLAYYVAQAREVIDLSLLSQKQIVDELQRLARQQAAGNGVKTLAGVASTETSEA